MFTRPRPGVAAVLLLAAIALAPASLASQQPRPIDLAPGDALAWRALGPFRAGPITAAAGDPSRHGVFYAGSAGAGLWKTTDFGAHWRPVFDAPPTGSVTALAVATSDSDVLYVTARAAGSAATLHRSDDAGVTWHQVGLSTRQPVSQIVVDPSDARRVFVVVHSAAPADGTHGVFRSTDAGVTFERILRTSGDDVGAAVVIHPRQPAQLTAIGMATDAAPSAVVHSADGGTTWQPARGLPAVDVRSLRAAFAAAADGAAFLVLASSSGGTLWHSTDAGASWTVVNENLPAEIRSVARPRLAVTSDGAVLLAAGVLFESRDAGRSFQRAAQPAGHDVDEVWTHPSMAGVRLLAGAGGAVVTVNDGETWSAADALSAAVVDRVSVDTSFPYRICATGARDVSCAPARGDAAARAPGAWQSLPRELTGPVVADPLDAEIVFGGASLRHDRRTGQTLNVEPAALPGSASGPALPLAFSADGRTLFAGARAVWRTVNGGLAWTAVSPELAASSERISALTVSPIDTRTLWAGLDDGRVFVTRSGGTEWVEGRRPSDTPGASVRSLEPSRFDTNSAYVVLAYGDTASDGARPRLLRTRDTGATWTDIGARIENAGAIHAVREDPFRRGLLVAGTDRSVFVSFDDGERWQRLALNLPATPVRDVVIKDADLIVATAGRGVWMLDDISVLRQVTADVLGADLFLFRPAQAWRVRATGGDAPDTGAGVPGSGAMLTYQLAQPAQDTVTLEVIETTTGDVIRRWSSRPADSTAAGGSSAPLPRGAGLHRVAWDLRYPPPVPGVAGAAPGTLVLPGTYQVRLTVDGRSVRQAITVRMDPRIRTSVVDLTAQRDLGRALDAARAAVAAARRDVAAPAPGGALAAPGGPLAALADELERLARAVQQADVKPAPRLEGAIEGALQRVSMALGVDTR